MDDIFVNEKEKEESEATPLDLNSDDLDIDEYFETVSTNLDELEVDSAFAKLFYDSYLSGDRVIYQKDIIETKVFDEEWIKTLESYFPSIDKITNTPKTGIRYEQEIVPVEKAKKINSESVRHLASHTHFVKEVRDGNYVIPKKILTSYAEQEFSIYENRFIKTLIDRLFVFVNNRYNVIKDNVLSSSKNHVNISSDFNINNASVNINVDVVIKKTVNSQNEKNNLYLLKRVEKLNRMIMAYKNSELYKKLINAPKVNPPIMQTNIIMKNPDFKNCYMLWLFLDKYNKLAYDLIVKEKNKKIDKKIEHGFDQTAMLAYLSSEANESVRKTKFDGESDEKTIKKSAKQIKKNEDDIITNPEVLSMEDNSINEYYLKQYKNMFKKNIDEFKKTASSDEVALKQAIRMVNSISNALYQSYFELEDEDIFTRLVKDVDPKEEFDETKKKAQIAKIIREVKEVDYNNAIRLEKRLNKDMAKASTKLIKSLEGKTNEDAIFEVKNNLDKEIDIYKKAKAKATSSVVTLDGKKVKVVKAKEDSKNSLKLINDTLKEKMREISKNEKERTKQKIKEMQAAHSKKVNDIIALEKANLDKILKAKKEKKSKQKEVQDKKIKEFKLKEKEKSRLQTEKVRKELKQKEIEKANEEKNKNKDKLIKLMNKDQNGDEKNV